jgi:hypothetical protein
MGTPGLAFKSFHVSAQEKNKNSEVGVKAFP